MTRRELWDCIYDAAAGVYDRREARAFAAFVCEGRLGMRFTDVIVEPDAPCPDREDLPDILAETVARPSILPGSPIFSAGSSPSAKGC